MSSWHYFQKINQCWILICRISKHWLMPMRMVLWRHSFDCQTHRLRQQGQRLTGGCSNEAIILGITYDYIALAQARVNWRTARLVYCLIGHDCSNFVTFNCETNQHRKNYNEFSSKSWYPERFSRYWMIFTLFRDYKKNLNYVSFHLKCDWTWNWTQIY